MASPADILDDAVRRATEYASGPIIANPAVLDRVEFVCRNLQNRSGIRALLACLLAKIHHPTVDVRKPYTEIGGPDTFSGRTYDERYISAFINKYKLPCNSTTAFLTPAFRNRNIVLTPDVNLVGRPPLLYKTLLLLLNDVYEGSVSAEDLLNEMVKCLLLMRDEKQQWMDTIIKGLKTSEGAVPLSAEGIVTLIDQHLKCRGASRLPVLVVAAAYQAAEKHLGERVLPLHAHNAADEQTGALGDLEIALRDDDNVITSYEMKLKKVTREDIDRALQKIDNHPNPRIDNYIFITTDVIEDDVKRYAASIYERTGGIELVVLDCIGFLRSFLHLFHRLRMQFLEAYQELVLVEPENVVSQALKEAFLALRQAAESVDDPPTQPPLI